MTHGLKKLADTFDFTKFVMMDIETTGLYRFHEEITLIQLDFINTQGGQQSIYIEWTEHAVEDWTKFFKYLIKKGVKLVLHNGKFDTLFIHQKTGVLLPITHDTLVMAHVLGYESLSLKDIVKKKLHITYDVDKETKTSNFYLKQTTFKKYLKENLPEDTSKKEITKYNKLIKALYEALDDKVILDDIKPFTEDLELSELILWASDTTQRLLADKKKKLYDYGLKDVIYLRKVAPMLLKELNKENLKHVYDYELRAYKAYQIVESGGVYVDPDRSKVKEWLKKEYTPILNKLKNVADINWNSATQIGDIIYGKLGLPVIDKTNKGQPSTSAGTLAKLSDYEVVQDLLEYRRLVRLETFIDSWEELIVDGELHPSFNITARTGRTTSSSVNLQQVPQNSHIRNLIRAREGYKFIECFSGDTEVLTKQGWVSFEQLEKDVEVAQYNINTEEITFAKPLEYIHTKDRETFSYEDRNTSLCATGNHNMLTRWGKRPIQKVPFKEIKISRGNCFINAGTYKNKPTVSKEITRFIVMFNADGSMSKKGNYVSFGFSKQRKIKRCKKILEEANIEYKLKVQPRGDTVFYLGNKYNDILLKYTDREKTLKWTCIDDLDLYTFIEESTYWDSQHRYGKRRGVRFITTNMVTAEVFQVMCNLSGVNCTKYTYPRKNLKHKQVYYCSYNLNRDTRYNYMKDGKYFSFDKPVIQDVYCVTMPLGTVVIRHKGKISIQGNCDFSQAELRVAADFAKETNMIDVYNSGGDIHSNTWRAISLTMGGDGSFSDDHDTAKRQRTQAKSVNFGFLYGMQAKSYIDYAKSYGLDLTLEEAEQFRSAFFEAYPKLLDWHKENINFARKNGYVESPLGRKRYLWDIYSNNWSKKAQAERQSLNSAVQGFASDCCISALADIVFDESMDHSKFRVLGSVHDAILIEAKEDYAEECAMKVKAHMENPSVLKDYKMKVPLIADVEVGTCWGG